MNKLFIVVCLFIFFNQSFGITNGELKVIKNMIKKGDIVFDVGANVGSWSEQVFSACSDVTIYAFEPIPSVYASLVKKNNNKNNFFTYNIAVSNFVGSKEFYFYPKESSKSGFYDREILRKVCNLVPEKIIVEVNTLSLFCNKNNISKIDFLKIDTEGEELNVLLGVEDFLKKSKIPIIQFEYGGCFQDSNITLYEVYSLLDHYGYEIFKIFPKELVKISRWNDRLEDFKFCNYLALAKNGR